MRVVQECIPVGCVPPTCAYFGGGGEVLWPLTLARGGGGVVTLNPDWGGGGCCDFWPWPGGRCCDLWPWPGEGGGVVTLDPGQGGGVGRWLIFGVVHPPPHPRVGQTIACENITFAMRAVKIVKNAPLLPPPQESIPVGCITPDCQPYMPCWQPDISTGGGSHAWRWARPGPRAVQWGPMHHM